MSDATAPPEVREEQDSLGHGTGIEVEEPEETQLIRQPFDPDKIDVITRNPTVDLLLSRIRSGWIDLEPDFQRQRGIWTDERQSRLIESLLLRIPLPTLYAAEGAEEKWAIVDGIQRLTAICRFVAPEDIAASRLVLSGLEYLGDLYDGSSYDDLPGRLQTRLRETELVVHLIRRGTPEEVKFNIFARINTGGMPLSTQELRHALIPGPARDLLKSWARSAEFVEATSDSVRGERMADREMVLRFIAFRLTPPEDYSAQDFDEFLRQAMRRLNEMGDDQKEALRQEFSKAMRAARLIFGDYAFRKQYPGPGRRLPINKAVFESVAVNLATLTDDEIRELVRRKDSVGWKLGKLITDLPFDRSVSQGTGDVAKVKLRFESISRIFREVLND
jgi:hypothetical protein